MERRGRIVVLGEHTRAGTEALRWAVQTAARDGLEVLVMRPFDRLTRADLALERDSATAAHEARYRTQAWVVEAVSDLDAPVTVGVSTPEGTALRTLVAAGDSAEMIVLGDDGTAATAALAAALRRSCPCPVAVVGWRGSAAKDQQVHVTV